MANDRYNSFLQMMGLLQGAYSTAGQLKNTADSIAVNKYQAEQQARQFDVNADYTKEGRDYSRGLTSEAAKQSAEYKVAEDEAKRLYKDWGTVKKVLNSDGYTFTYSPAKMDEWEYKKIKEQGLSSGGYNQPKDNSTKLGSIIGAYTYMGPETGWQLTSQVEPQTQPKVEFSQLLKDLTTTNRDKYKNILPVVAQNRLDRSGDTLVKQQQNRMDSDNIYSDLPSWNPNAELAGVETKNPSGKALFGGYAAMGSVANPWLLSLFPFGKGGK